MVGDRLYSDIYGAKRVGMHTVWFRYGKYADKELVYEECADFKINDLLELPEILEVLNNGSNKKVPANR